MSNPSYKGPAPVPSRGGYEWDVNGHRFHYKIVFNATVDRV
jgi:hypothetical protein